jgi:hypothetical protein
MRFYFTAIRGLGDENDPFRCPLYDTQNSSFDFLDGREFPEIEDGWLFAWTDNSDIEHAAALLEPDITYLPIEDNTGTLIDFDSPVGQIPAANRTAILAELESKGIPTDGITGTTTIREAMRLVIKRIRLMEQLRYIDFDESLTTVISDIPAKKRKALKRRLENLGFNVAPLVNTMTMRESINELIAQNKGPLSLLPF